MGNIHVILDNVDDLPSPEAIMRRVLVFFGNRVRVPYAPVLVWWDGHEGKLPGGIPICLATTLRLLTSHQSCAVFAPF
jgi:hypothetical protein